METHHSRPKDLAKKSSPGVPPSLATAGFTAAVCWCSNCDTDLEQNVETVSHLILKALDTSSTQKGQGAVEVQLQEF